jgi:spermidine synthase
MVVAVFVLGIAAGSLAIARARRLSPRLLFRLQASAACWLLLLFPTLDVWPYGSHVLRVAFQATTIGFWMYEAAVLAALALLLVVPAALLGATLPAIFHELDASVSRSGWLSGRLLAWNGLGTLLGSLCGSFLLYYALDAVRVFLLVPLAVSGAAVLVSGPASRSARRAAWALLLVATAAIVARPFHEDARFAVGTFRTREPEPYSLHGARVFYEEHLRGMRLVSYEDGPTATVAVVENERDRPTRALFVNGKSESSTINDAITLRLLAHLPALWAERRASALVIGLGTGVTAGELSLYRDIDRIDVAEISPTVVRALPRFTDYTHGVERDARLRIHVRDAWLVLRQARESWDVISAEPSNPWVSGVDQLFTREFYRLVAGRLADGGVFVQWVQLYESDFEALALVLNSLRAELPTLHAFRGMTGDLLLVAAREPFDTADRRRAEEVLAGHPAVADSLRSIGIESIGQILEREVTSLPTLLRQGARYGVNTLDHPRLHYLAGRHLFLGSRVTDEMLRGVTDMDFLFDPEFRRSQAGAGSPR